MRSRHPEATLRFLLELNDSTPCTQDTSMISCSCVRDNVTMPNAEACNQRPRVEPNAKDMQGQMSNLHQSLTPAYEPYMTQCVYLGVQRSIIFLPTDVSYTWTWNCAVTMSSTARHENPIALLFDTPHSVHNVIKPSRDR